MKKVLPFLAVAFSGFIVYLFDKIWGDSIDWEQFKSFKIGEILMKEIQLYQIVIFILISILLFYIGKKFFNNNQFYTRKQRKLIKINSLIIEDSDVLLRWNVYFDYNTPFIDGLTPFCKKHQGAPIRFINNSCPVQGCENNRKKLDEWKMKNEIESNLIDKWEKIK